MTQMRSCVVVCVVPPSRSKKLAVGKLALVRGDVNADPVFLDWPVESFVVTAQLMVPVEAVRLYVTLRTLEPLSRRGVGRCRF